MIGCDVLLYMIGYCVLENVYSCLMCEFDFLSEEDLVVYWFNINY